MTSVIDLNEIGNVFFHCGASERSLAVVIPILQSYLDESSDGKQENIFCVGGFLANEQNWRSIQDAWVERLRVPDEVEYFRASDCKGCHGSFLKLRRKYGSGAQGVADKIRSDLEAIILSHHWIGFGLGILIPDYQEVRRAYPLARRLFMEEPVEAAFSQMFFEIARATQREAPTHQVAYLIDESTYSGKIADAFKGVKVNHPLLSGTMARVTPKDDKTTPPLQMADLVASIIRGVFIEWLNNGKTTEYVPLERKWQDHFEIIGKWDKEHMLTNIAETVGDIRFESGMLAARPLPPPTASDLKRKEKKRRKALVKAAALARAKQ